MQVQELVQKYLESLIWEKVCNYYEVLINDDVLDYLKHDYHAQTTGQQYKLFGKCLKGF